MVVGSSPPRGRFSHLAMFRLGTFLFIPGYLTVAMYRVFAGPESGGSLLLMIRECHLRLLNCTAHETLFPKSLDNQHVSVFCFLFISVSN
jgi:hypothetical protein